MDSQINLLQDVYNSKSVNTITPQAAVVKGVVNLFLLQDQTNNLDQSQFNFVMPVGLRQISQQKNSMKYPLKYVVNSVPNYTTTGQTAIGNWYYKSLQTNIVEARMYLERSLNDGYLPLYTSANMPLSETAQINVELSQSAATTSTNLAVDSLGVGVDYTFAIGQAQNFKNQDYSLVLDSGINTSNSRLPGTYRASSYLQQIFVRNTAFFNTKTLVKTM